MMNNYNEFLTILIILIAALGQQIHKFPLTYAFTPDFQHKFPIKISFNETQTFVPFQSDQLYLFNLNVSMEIHRISTPQSQNNSVIIGLKEPSTFLISIQSFFKVPPHQIQFGKEEFLQLLINDNSFVESPDFFINQAQYSIEAVYNFGDVINVQSQNCKLIDSDLIYFDEIFVRQMLNFMDSRNKIEYSFDEQRNLVTLQGNMKNFPKITLKKDNSLFRLSIKNENTLYYLPREQNDSKGINIIGYHSMQEFSKFEIDHEKIIFKRTSQFYQLYLFLGYFFGFVLITIFFQKKNLFDSMKFVKNLIKWIIFENPQSRLQVLRTQLE